MNKLIHENVLFHFKSKRPDDYYIADFILWQVVNNFYINFNQLDYFKVDKASLEKIPIVQFIESCGNWTQKTNENCQWGNIVKLLIHFGTPKELFNEKLL